MLQTVVLVDVQAPSALYRHSVKHPVGGTVVVRSVSQTLLAPRVTEPVVTKWLVALSVGILGVVHVKDKLKKSTAQMEVAALASVPILVKLTRIVGGAVLPRPAVVEQVLRLPPVR